MLNVIFFAFEEVCMKNTLQLTRPTPNTQQHNRGLRRTQAMVTSLHDVQTCVDSSCGERRYMQFCQWVMSQKATSHKPRSTKQKPSEQAHSRERRKDTHTHTHAVPSPSEHELSLEAGRDADMVNDLDQVIPLARTFARARGQVCLVPGVLAFVGLFADRLEARAICMTLSEGAGGRG